MKLALFLLFLVSATYSIPLFEKLKNSLQSNSSCTQDCCKSLSQDQNRMPMVYYFYQNTGRLRGGDGTYAIDTKGYSGQGKGYLNPDYQCVSSTGPLPASTYRITYCKNIMHETVQRPCAFYLQPQNPDEMCGRSAFFIHGCDCCTPGDSTQPPSPGCSAGCIVIKYEQRRKIRIGDVVVVQHYEPKEQVLAE